MHASCALVLLLLFAHAYFVSATHGFRSVTSRAIALSAASTVDERRAQAEAEVNGHAECLLCRLQRNLLAELDNPATSLTPPASAPIRLAAFSTPRQSSELLLLAAGRAPPHA